MAIKQILILGNPRLYNTSDEVKKEELKAVEKVIDDLHDTLMEFRRKNGAGRAIAAPQIDILKRIIYMHIDKSVVFINPKMEYIGDEKFEVWDDCMSFPGIKGKSFTI